MSEELRIRERLALLLMSDCDDSRRFIIYLVYKTIEKNPGITVNQLSSLLRSKLSLSKSKIDAAISVLTSNDLLNSVSTWTEKPGVIHLRCKDSNFNEWLNSFCDKVPEACGYEAPVFVAKVK